MIRKQMQEFEITMSGVAAKTQALRSLKVRTSYNQLLLGYRLSAKYLSWS